MFRSRRWHKIGLFMLLLLTTFIASVVAVVALRAYSGWRAKGYIYSLDSVPARSVAIVFGAGYSDIELSEVLMDRVKTGAALYRAGKARVLLFTGDNSTTTYDEPEAMRDYAHKLGIPDNAIVLDYAGYRTYDSCYRARDIFKVDKAILITQAFHLDRALFLCNSLGIDSVGVAADVMRPEGYGLAEVDSQMREIPATALSIFDLLRGATPTWLGDPLPILPPPPG